MTPVERLAQYVRERHGSNISFENFVSALKQQEKASVQQAVLYSLDEDGHTGDWKLSFAERYYREKYDIQTPEQPVTASEEDTWQEIEEEYHRDEYPTFGGPFTDALTHWEWLRIYYHPPVRKEAPTRTP